MFDVDEHPGVDQALHDADRHDIGVALSNPCIELRFLLHWQDQTAYIERHDAQRAAAHHVGASKLLNPAAAGELVARYELARVRAIDLDKRHLLNGSASRSNPSTSAWQLVDSLRRHQRPA